METIKLNIVVNKDWLEATWTKEVTTINEVEKDGELVQEDSVATEQVHCESFSGHREHIMLLKAKAKEFNTPLDEFEDLIKKCEDSFVYPNENDIKREADKNRILCIKSEAGRVISEKYSIIWQLNHPRLSGKYIDEYTWIDNIREISNKAEVDGIEYNQIDWGVL